MPALEFLLLLLYGCVERRFRRRVAVDDGDDSALVDGRQLGANPFADLTVSIPHIGVGEAVELGHSDDGSFGEVRALTQRSRAADGRVAAALDDANSEGVRFAQITLSDGERFIVEHRTLHDTGKVH